MTIEHVAPEHIKVSDTETALKITQAGSGNAFVVEDSESPDTSAFVIDNQGRVGIKKTPTRDLDVDGVISANNIVPGYLTTATSEGTLTLTASSAQQQFFTGTQNHTVILPVASTLTAGHFFTFHNNSTGTITVNSSGGNLVRTISQNTTVQLTCIVASGTDASSWDVDTAEGSAYSSTITSNGTLTLNVSSAQRQFFTGTQNHTVVLPVVSTLTLGQYFVLENNSSGTIAVQSSGLNAVVTIASNRSVQLTAISTSGTGAASWDVEHGGASSALATTSYVDTSISNLVASAPAALDTLNELAASLNNDANFATTVTNALAGKVNDTGDTITGEVIITVNTSGTALRVTQVGAGDALRIEDESNPDASPLVVKADGSVGIGTDSPSNKLSVVGSVGISGTGSRFIGSGAIYSVTSTTRPGSPVQGDVIYETDTKLFFGWDGTVWKPIGGGGANYQTTAPTATQVGELWIDSDATAGGVNQNDYLTKTEASTTYQPKVKIQATQPSSPSAGDMWLKSTTKEFFVYSGTEWVGVTGGSGSKSFAMFTSGI